MILETRDFSQLADAIAALKKSQSFKNPALQNRHGQIQRKLSSLERFFRTLASMSEENENTLLSRQKIQVPASSGGYAYGSGSGSLAGIAAGGSCRLTGAAGYALGAASAAWSGQYAEASLQGCALSASVSGSAYLRLMQGKKFSPSLRLEAQGSAALASGAVSGRVGNDLAGLSLEAVGEAGSVYGEARAVFSVDEQVISAQIGAAAARGECVLAFDLADIRVSVGISGSVGSVEAGFEYANQPGNWQVSLNGALFAGGGLRIEVDY